LKYHPDRQIIRHDVKQNNHVDEGGSSSLKFQAVSAAYQILMDDVQRAYYDKTGIIREDDEHDHHHDDNSNSSTTRHTSSTNRHRGGNTRDWKTFFESVFNDIQQVGKNHNEVAKNYRNSNDEMIDVLRYYTLCQGDMNLVVECVPYGHKTDIDRWNKDIIYPAILCGKILNTTLKQ
jgi:DnaJ-class molecular chaperone